MDNVFHQRAGHLPLPVQNSLHFFYFNNKNLIALINHKYRRSSSRTRMNESRHFSHYSYYSYFH